MVENNLDFFELAVFCNNCNLLCNFDVWRHFLKKFSDWNPDKVKFYFSETQGVLGTVGKKPNAKV